MIEFLPVSYFIPFEYIFQNMLITKEMLFLEVFEYLESGATLTALLSENGQKKSKIS